MISNKFCNFLIHCCHIMDLGSLLTTTFLPFTKSFSKGRLQKVHLLTKYNDEISCVSALCWRQYAVSL